MSFLENLENSLFNDEPANGYIVNPKVTEIIEEMKKDPDHQDLMQKLAGMEEETWDNEGGTLIDRLSLEEIERYNERLKYMEEYGI